MWVGYFNGILESFHIFIAIKFLILIFKFLHLHIVNNFYLTCMHYRSSFYTTKGRDRFHWAAKQSRKYLLYDKGIVYCTFFCLWNIFSQKTANFVKISKSGDLYRSVFRNVYRSRMPNQRTSQSKIKDIEHCKCISLLNKTTSALLIQVQNY